MRLKTGFFIFILVVSVATTSAIEMDTSVKINTAPNFNVTLSVKDLYDHYQFLTKDSGEDGSVVLTFPIKSSSYEISTITLKRHGDKEAAYFKRFEDEHHEAGEFLELEIYPKWYTPPEPEKKNETQLENTSKEEIGNTTSQDEKNLNLTLENKEQKLTAFSISNGEIRINGRVLLYALGLIILGFLTITLIRGERKKPKKEKKIKITKLSEINKVNEDRIKEQEEKIEQAKKEIQQAQEELIRLKSSNKNKIEMAKEKLIKDEKELMKLREESKTKLNKNF